MLKTDEIQARVVEKISTLRSMQQPSDLGVFSKVEEGGFPVPFPRRAGPEDDHSTGAGASKFRPEVDCLGSEKDSESFPGRKKGEGAAAAVEGKKRELGLGFGGVK